MWYNKEVAARKWGNEKVISSTVSWKLNNALQVQKTLEIQESVREDDKKHKTSQWVTDRIDINRFICVYTTLLKSLILAQDERWRHA